MPEEISLAFSSCPNDTFIFDALVHQRIDTEGIRFKYTIEDVETLNQMATKVHFDVSKMSFHGLFHVLRNYVSLTSGAALCDDFGPVVVARKFIDPAKMAHSSLAVPGMFTSAALIFNLFFKAGSVKPFLFSDIENVVINGEADMGLIIHENVFTYKALGLKEIANLGVLWSKAYNLPVPLGCIAVKRTLPLDLQQKINRVLLKSIQYAFENPRASDTFVKEQAVSLSDNIIRKHIKTYVNTYSLKIDARAAKAVDVLYGAFAQNTGSVEEKLSLFIDN